MEVVVPLECLRNRRVCTEVDLLLTGSACPSSWDYLSTKFSCRFLLDPPWYHTLHAMKGLFIGYFFMYTFVPAISPICCLFAVIPVIGVSQYFSPILGSLDISQSHFWDFDQDALLDGPIQGLAGRSKTTVLYLKANCSSLLYHRAYRKWKEFAVTRPFNGNVFPI